MNRPAASDACGAAVRARLEQRLRAAAPRWHIRVLDRVMSTQDTARRMAERRAPDRTAVLAREQTAGRGRQGRRWKSLRDRGVYLSVLLRCDWAAADTGWLPMLAAVATIRALADMGVAGARVKPPNDVVTDRGKIAGILTEPRLHGSRIEFAVLGVGINATHDEKDLAAAGLRGRATSCQLEGVTVSVEELAAAWLKRFDELYHREPLSRTERRAVMQAWRAAGGPPEVPGWP